MNRQIVKSEPQNNDEDDDDSSDEDDRKEPFIASPKLMLKRNATRSNKEEISDSKPANRFEVNNSSKQARESDPNESKQTDSKDSKKNKQNDESNGSNNAEFNDAQKDEMKKKIKRESKGEQRFNRRSSMPYVTKTGKELEEPEQSDLYSRNRAPGFSLLASAKEFDFVDNVGWKYWSAARFPKFLTTRLELEANAQRLGYVDPDVYFVRPLKIEGQDEANLPSQLQELELTDSKGQVHQAMVILGSHDAPSGPRMRKSGFLVLDFDH